jgi:hypothetical protein
MLNWRLLVFFIKLTHENERSLLWVRGSGFKGGLPYAPTSLYPHTLPEQRIFRDKFCFIVTISSKGDR